MEMTVKTREGDISTPKQHKKPIDGPEYSIYNFLRTNTGFAIAVISGIVAVSSFVFRYASTLYNYSYLRFWDIDTAYARQEDAGVFYFALGIFFYYCLMIPSQFLLGNTASAYDYHNRIYLVARDLQKKLKKKRKVTEKIKRRLHKRLKREVLDNRKKRLIERISKIDARIVELSTSPENRKVMRKYKIRLIIKAVFSIAISFLLCMAGSWFLSLNYKGGARTGMFWVLATAPVLFSFIMYALPKHPKINNGQELEKELDQYQKELEEDKTKLFPAEAWGKRGVKYYLSNKMMGAIVAEYLITVVICIMVLFDSGSRDAKQLREFRVWTDGISTYAIIYDNGSQVIMEPITIQGDSAVIDASSQRIIKLDDLSYEIYTFDAVEVIRNDSNDGTTKGNDSEIEYPS